MNLAAWAMRLLEGMGRQRRLLKCTAISARFGGDLELGSRLREMEESEKAFKRRNDICKEYMVAWWGFGQGRAFQDLTVSGST